ncbi:hypothetical protein Cgig2_031450 [Carnegiea gigantea]|uniref:Uncharacterized protein n=1 Tax=Carnegiea gigantea TaxID=171969 RepID=A0A9Q1K7N2_9CARY|nr:hypothetical protein Cgig2_031450 [Carnegiea gigantea]
MENKVGENNMTNTNDGSLFVYRTERKLEKIERIAEILRRFHRMETPGTTKGLFRQFHRLVLPSETSTPNLFNTFHQEIENYSNKLGIYSTHHHLAFPSSPENSGVHDVTSAFSATIAITVLRHCLTLTNQISEINREIRVNTHNLVDIPVDFTNQGDILDQILRNLRLMILVHLLNQRSVLIKHRLNSLNSSAQRLPRLGVALLVAGYLDHLTAAIAAVGSPIGGSIESK